MGKFGGFQRKHLGQNLFLYKIINFVDLQLHYKRVFSERLQTKHPLIIPVSIVAKREFANETVNYDAKTKTYVPI